MSNEVEILKSLSRIETYQKTQHGDIKEIKEKIGKIVEVNSAQDSRIAVLQDNSKTFKNHIKYHWRFVGVIGGCLGIIGAAVGLLSSGLFSSK